MGDLIARLDFHPLSIDLLARSVHENEWDEPMLKATNLLYQCGFMAV